MADPAPNKGDKAALQAHYLDLINSLASLIRNSQIHDPANEAVVKSLDRALSLLNDSIQSTGELHLKLVGEFIFVNEERLRYLLDSMLNFDFLVRELKKREVGEVTFNAPLTDSQLRDFVTAFIGSGFSDNAFEMLRQQGALHRITVSRQKVAEEDALDRRQFVRRSYFNAVSYTKGVMGKVKSGEQINLRKAKRIVESLVDHLVAEPTLLLGMTAIKDYDEYTYFHSVNVSILSIALGQKLGLTKRALEQIGVASFFHDIGKTEVPESLLNKPTSFTDKEWEVIKQHPKWGFLSLLRLKGFEETAMKSALAAFQHHLNHDRSGYPQVISNLDHDLISEIVTISDKYDAMTSSRVYARVPLSPDRALSMLMEQGGRQVNPVLVKVFVNLIGVYPQGSLVLLNTREMGLVFESNPNPQCLDRPRVLVVMDAKGRRLNREAAPAADLMEQDSSGGFRRTIVRSLDPNEYGISLADFLL